MRCEYCDCEVTTYPENGICIHCGGKLPPKPAEPLPTTVQEVIQPIYIPVPPQPQPVYSSAMRCPKCNSDQVTTVNRGFSWGLALLGFFLIPGWGLLLGFIGRRKPRQYCASCKRKWKL